MRVSVSPSDRRSVASASAMREHLGQGQFLNM